MLHGRAGLRPYQCPMQPSTAQLDTRDRRIQLSAQTSSSPPTDLHGTTPPARAQLTQNRKHVYGMHLIVVYHLSSPTRGGSFVSHISEFPYCLAPLEVPLRRPFSHSWSIGQFAHVLCNHLDADVVFYYLFLSLVLIL